MTRVRCSDRCLRAARPKAPVVLAGADVVLGDVIVVAPKAFDEVAVVIETRGTDA